MLKGKKGTYILLLAAVLIWGLVGYSIYDGLKEDELDELDSSATPPVMSVSGADTFRLFNNYRDPFLSNLHKSSSPGMGSKRDNTPKMPNKGPVIAKASTPPVTNDWPSVQYAGIIKNQTSSTALVLLNIGGKMYTLKLGEMADGLQLLSVSNTEVVLARGKEKRSVAR